MQSTNIWTLIAYFLLLVTLTPPVGGWIAKVFSDKTRRPRALETWILRVAGVDGTREMTWIEYSKSLLLFNFVSIGVVFLFQRLQAYLPWNPQHVANVRWDSALNTAVSFVTNTNWQGYAGEATMSNLTQMGALVVQNFLSAATGLAVAIALIRGIARRSGRTLGNFWSDMIRASIYVLLPLSIILALIFAQQGVVQTFAPFQEVTTLEGAKQIIPLGPVASQEAIKMVGTNGGGFFNANSAHPFENPTPLTNFLQMLAIFLIPAALTFTYGMMTESRRHGWVLFLTMLILFLGLTAVSLWSENLLNPIFNQAAIMEGKEVRFGIFDSILFSTITTSASCGAVNAMHASLSPLSGGVAMINMMLGEIVFGGVGAGLYGMLLFVFLTVFIAGLMVGRTPEYMGKKIESREITMVLLGVLAPCVSILLLTAISLLLPTALSSLSSAGPHGFSEMLYTFTSAVANNGSAFAGLNANTPYMNLMTALAMFIGRYAIIIPVLAIAGSLVQKKTSPPSLGTFQVDNVLFSFLLISVILIVGALTFVPALSLGPIVEHLLMLRGRTF